jgi:ABC-type glutathione transport system ATPase component
VAAERQTVKELVHPFVLADADSTTAIDYSAIDRDEVPPVIMHKLEKAYPALGGRPPKVALKSLDLHVARGQVLGFLGKNGAG